MIVPLLRELVSFVTSWTFGFDPGSVPVRFVVENVVLVLVQALIQVLRFSPAIIIPQMLHTDLQSTCCSYQKGKRAKLENLKNAVLFRRSWTLDRNVPSLRRITCVA